MLMTVLRGELAIQQSRALVKTFKKMKDYILENRDLIGQRKLLQLSMETANNRIEISKIKHLLSVSTSFRKDVKMVIGLGIANFSFRYRFLEMARK